MRKLYCLITLFCCTYANLAQTADKHPVTEIRIDPTYARGGAASLFFKEISYIPLETTKESYFGQIDKLEVTNDYFIILDRETDAILIFNKNGSFASKITGIAGVTKKKEYWQTKPSNVFDNFCVDHFRNTIIVSSGYMKGHLFVFDFRGNQLEKPYLIPKRSADFIVLGPGIIATRPSRPDIYEDKNGREHFDVTGYEPFSLFLVNEDSSVKQKLLPINNTTAPKENESLGHYLNFSQSDVKGRAFFKRFFDYRIFEVSDKGIEREYVLFFPMNRSLPAQFFSDSVFYRRAYFSKSNIYFAIDDVYRTGHILSLSFSAVGSVVENKTDILYNEITGNSIFLGDVKGDQTTFYLNPTTLTSKIMAASGSYFYTSLSSLDMHEARKLSGKTSFNKKLNDYFKHSGSKDNPVIVQLYPKEMF